jgi:hypothetical protein
LSAFCATHDVSANLALVIMRSPLRLRPACQR